MAESMTMQDPRWITPDWPAPAGVRAAATVRTGGVSAAPFDSLNLGIHVGDELAAVLENRRRLVAALQLPAEPAWLNQVHGCDVLQAAQWDSPPTADGSFTSDEGVVCAVMTADCLPVLLCDQAGGCVAAVHAGWRGLADGVVGSAIASMGVAADSLLAWLGPAIEPSAFEVGGEVRERFIEVNAANDTAFTANQRGRWQADIYALARNELHRLGVRQVYGGGFATHGDAARFFSYRRDGQTGRMVSLIWREPRAG